MASGHLELLPVVALLPSQTTSRSSGKQRRKCSTLIRSTVLYTGGSLATDGTTLQPELMACPSSSGRIMENLKKTFQDKYGSTTPLKELPAQSYFEVLEETVQDRLFYAESFAQVVSLEN